MSNIAKVQSKLVAAQNCHPQAVQTLIAEALTALAEIERAYTAAPVAQQPQAPLWWRKRADEIEVAVARGLSAMACYTQMRGLMQAVDAAAQQPQADTLLDGVSGCTSYDQDRINEAASLLRAWQPQVKAVADEPSIAACIIGSEAVGGVIDGYQAAKVYRAMRKAAPQQAEAVAWRSRDANGRWMYGDLPAPELPAGEPELLTLRQQAEMVPDGWYITERLNGAAKQWPITDRQALAISLPKQAETGPSDVTDAMALAFHRALTDGSIGQSEVDDIKTGLRAALAAQGEKP